jgi:PEGA domain
MRITTYLAMVLSVPFCGGCATLLRGSRQTLSFRTIPSGAQIDIDGKTYISPADVSLRRKEAHTVVITKEGYRTLKFALDSEMDGISLVGNIILPGGSVGLVVDVADGADKNFFKLAKIDLIPSTQPDEPAVVLNDFKGHLLTDEQVKQAVVFDRQDRTQFFRGEP